MKNEPRLLKAEEAASLLGLTVAGIRRWIMERRIPYVKVGQCVRIEFSAIERLIDRGRVPARDGQR